ncbi:hypothetical protein [Serratia odorifera]|uniref:Uncharacterized protein n=2 Tax=Serratia odorifera TaxID=618 RepID=D4E9T8_SEROD|nr:hypothetical protein [Serratia odorifera]EFE93424.1 hypothetical protein HMPREF0758_4938 [Serratia odorifera DSM 4582]PNK88261.1 hypothetical protein CEQ31_000270 [Serratia odorifera]PNK88384.1 hypothetical protein CEQ31_000995 [Serratia odorifera]RII74087.1 hypothetical protein DX901_00365 [Serratia odorifera]
MAMDAPLLPDTADDKGLAVAHANSGPMLDTAAAEVTVNVTVRPVGQNVSISPSGSVPAQGELTLKCTISAAQRWLTCQC